MENIDRISNLHDSILSHILSFLPIEEAVGTSVLSTRWRYLFSLLPNIDFDLDDDLRHENLNRRWTGTDAESFRSFVDRMLSLENRNNVDKFCLKGGINVDSNRIYRWISAAVQRGVKHLDLDIYTDKIFTLPGCRTLVTLKLILHHTDFVLDVANGFHFPNLKTLDLESVTFLNDHSVRCLLSGCCSLEDMVMDRCVMHNESNFNISHPSLKRLTIRYLYLILHDSWLIIDTPNLAYFTYSGSLLEVRYSLENLPSLVKADIHIDEKDHLQADATAFFRGICNFRSLILSSTSLKHLLSCEPLPVFATLAELEIRYDPKAEVEYLSSRYDHWKSGLETLLTSCRELEKLAFPEDVLCFLPENPSLLLKLKEIEISNFRNHRDCIRKAKYILKNGRALEKLKICTKSNISHPYYEEKAEMLSWISNLLLASPRKSKQCRIFII